MFIFRPHYPLFLNFSGTGIKNNTFIMMAKTQSYSRIEELMNWCDGKAVAQ